MIALAEDGDSVMVTLFTYCMQLVIHASDLMT